MSKKMLDISGNKFGELIAIQFHSRGILNRPKWLCKCSCGNEKVVYYSFLMSGHTKSCGCLKRINTVRANVVHGQSRNDGTTSEYAAWQGMKTRCYNKNSKHYKDYGGRGISICDRWLQSFENFFEDMGKRPSNKHSLDRFPNNDGNYEPSNCRWATKMQQAANCRSNHWVEYNGEKMIVADWARKFNTTDNRILERIKNGLPLEGRVFKLQLLNLMTGAFYDTIQEAAFSENIKYGTFYYRIKSGVYKNKYQLL